MKLPTTIPLYGTQQSGKCPHESVEQVTFFNRLRHEYPDTYGAIAVHVRNEGELSHAQVIRHKAQGMTPGAADIVIPGNPSFVCEMKSRSKTARISEEQIKYLEAAQAAGAFVCVALGYEGAWAAFEDWKRSQNL